MPASRHSARHHDSAAERVGGTIRQAPKGMLGLLLGTGAALTGLAFWAGRQTREAEKANPPAGTFVEASGVRLHVLAGGSGRPVVFLHGLDSMAQDWRLSLLDQAERSWHCLAFDRPGYGWSERPGWSRWNPEKQAELLRTACARLGIERPLVVGHSFGGLVALAWALDYPEDVAGLVLVAPYVYPTRVKAPFMAAQTLGGLGALARNTLSPMLARSAMDKALRRVFAPNPVPAGMALYPVDMNARPGQMRAQAEEFLQLAPSANRLSPRYAEIRVPVAIVTGDEDQVIDPIPHSIRLHRTIRHSTLTVVPETGHMVHHIAPGEVLKAIGLAWHESDVQARAMIPPTRRTHEARPGSA